MEIKQFIENTLVQIFEGVESAKNKISDNSNSKSSKAVVNPCGKLRVHSDVQKVEFDIAVTVTERTTSEGGGKLTVMGISAGGSKSNNISSEAISRIKFSVPIAMPSTPVDTPIFGR